MIKNDEQTNSTPAPKPLLRALDKIPEFVSLRENMLSGNGAASVFGLAEANRLHMAAALYESSERTLLFVAPSPQAAMNVYEDISCYIPDAMLFSARELPLNAHTYVQSQELSAKRLNVLMRLIDGRRCLIVAPIEALMQRLAPPELLADTSITVRNAMTIKPSALLGRLIDAGYERVDICEGAGQVCLRGGCIDVFPVASPNPVRIEFFDDEIDTMREFDPVSQRSTENIKLVRIPPASELPLNIEMRRRGIAALRNRAHYEHELEILREGGTPANSLSLLPLFSREDICLSEYLPGDALVIVDEPIRVEESAKYAYSQFIDGLGDVLKSGEGHPMQEGLLCTPSEAIARLDTGATAMLFALTRSYGLIQSKAVYKFETRPVPRYLPGDEALKNDIALWKQKGCSVLLYAGEHGQRLADMLKDMGIDAPYTGRLTREVIDRELLIIGESIPRGFEYSSLKLVVISEHELFGSEYRPAVRHASKKRPQLTLYELNAGDLIVHETHGIGRFVGVSALTVSGKTRDYIELVYQSGDKLFIPTDQMDRVQKYIGGDDGAQKLSKLGSGEWQRTVSRTRDSVKKLAHDLIKLYGDRQRMTGFRFSKDTEWQQRLEMSFPYRETPDQLTAIAQIKADMESERIMDRLLCGDVGYGKTEVALRAAFKCAMDGKQCAFLVPTTILAQQHYNTISSRFSGFPVRVQLLSRFKTPKQQEAIKKELREGAIDVIIGTHCLLAKDVKFKDLGLLIIDEEQRFGVNHKEQIKDIKRSVDVLTLSATPIPRTLHMSMSGIRDMSVIETPPEARYPVQTYVVEYTEALAREAILKETARGGQVYFVYNNVKRMDLFAARLAELVPEASITYVHGQMSERRIENTMLDFMEHRYDVLLCSTIIESGLDISNVNTMIVYDSDCMGLSQLYQLRGRVGRGARLGYVYFTYHRDKVLSEVADRRLSAIKEFTQFGAGFRVALRDLEIRGAGDVLGAEQHGHMSMVGYELYCKLIDQAVKELKGEKVKPDIDITMEINIDASIPKKYIPRESGRMAMYKRIASIHDLDSLRDVQDELIDRYGNIPRPVQNLLDISLYKSRAAELGASAVSVRENELRITFDARASLDAGKLLSCIQKLPGAAFQGGEVTALVIKRKAAPAEEMFGIAKEAINLLLTCIDGDKDADG